MGDTGPLDGQHTDDVIEDVRDARLIKVKELIKGKSRYSQVMIVDDDENIVAALEAGVHLFTLFMTENTAPSDRLLQLIPGDVDIQRMSVKVSKELFGVDKRSRIFALARKSRRNTLSELINLGGDVLVLDGVRLMGNIGAIIRSTRALGFAGIVLVDSALEDVMDRRLIRASRGMVFSLPVVLAGPDEAVDALDAAGFSLISLEPRVSTEMPEIADVPGRVAVLLGSEKNGPSERLKAVASRSMTITIHPAVESLNVSVTAALVMYQRRASNPFPTESSAERD